MMILAEFFMCNIHKVKFEISGRTGLSLFQKDIFQYRTLLSNPGMRLDWSTCANRNISRANREYSEDPFNVSRVGRYE